MKNWITFNLILTLLVSGIFSVSASGDAGNSDTAQETQDNTEEMLLREDASVREVNDAAAAEIERIKAARRTRYIDEELGYVPDVNLISSEQLSTIEKERAEKERTIRSRFGSVSQEEAQAEQQATGTQHIEFKPAAPAPVARGTVTGIVLYNNKGAALIAGEIVRENDILMGVKVTRINQDSVELEKQGKKWTQEVGHPPPAGVWEEPKKTDKQTSPAQRPSAAPTGKPGR